MYDIIGKRKIWLSLSGFFVLLSIASLFFFGLNFGIDFTGGALMEVEFKGSRPAIGDIQAKLSELELGSLVSQAADEKGLILRFQDISEEKHQQVLAVLDELSGFEKKDSGLEATTTGEKFDIEAEAPPSLPLGLEELRYESVGPSIGEDLKRRSITAIIIVLAAIVLYIAWAFRKVSKPVASWKYGMSAIIALFHDVLITLGIFSVLGYVYDIEINTAFVAAILTVLGYSVNDTIVVFDRVRESLPKSEDNFPDTVNISVNQTIIRSINTSFTTLAVLLSILFLGGETIRDFILALCLGVFAGTYSSIFLASPVLAVWEKMGRK